MNDTNNKPNGQNTQPSRPVQPVRPNTQAPRTAQPAVPNTQAPRAVQPVVPNRQAPRPQQTAPNAQPPVKNASQVEKKPEAEQLKQSTTPKSKKQEKQHRKARQKAGSNGKKGGAIAVISIVLVLAIVIGVVGVAVAIFAGKDGEIFDDFGVNSNSAVVEAGAVADVTFRDNITIISDTVKVQEDFVEVIIEGEEYTLNYGAVLPQELSSLSQGDMFCVPSIKGAEVSCFARGFCGEVISKTSNSITFKVPSMEEVFSDFSFHLQGDVADSAEFIPAAGVSVIENKPITKGNFTPLAASMPNISLAKGTNYDAEFEIGDYTIKPEFSYVEPSQQSVLPEYSMFCDSLKLKIEIEEDREGYSIENSLSGTIEMEDLATKTDIEMHEDESGNMQLEEFDVGFMANVKTELAYTGTIGTDFQKLATEYSFLRKKSENNNVINIKDVTENEKGKLILGSYVIGYDVKLPGLENQVNQISYLSAGLVIQVFVTASGEIEGKFSIENSGFYSAEFDSINGYSGQCKGYDYFSPALYTGEYSQEQLDSKPATKVGFEGEVTFNAATGVDFGICILGFVPSKLAINFIECDIKLDGSLETGNINFSDFDKFLVLKGSQFCTAKSNITFKLYIGAGIDTKIFDTDVKAMAASFGFEKVLYNKIHYQYPNPIDFNSSQCGFGNIFIGETYTAKEMDEIFKQFEKDHGINSVFSDFKDGVGNVVMDTLKYELNYLLSQFDVSFEEEDWGSVKYYSSGVMYFMDENNKVVMSIITGEDVCNAAGLAVGTEPHDAEIIYSAPNDSTTIKLDIDEGLRLILKESGLDLGDIENRDIIIYKYIAKDTKDEMQLIYADGKLKAIIVVDI